MPHRRRTARSTRTAVLTTAALLVLGVLGLPAAAQTAPVPDTGADVERISATDVTPTDEAWFFRFRQPVPELPEGVEDPTGGYFGIARAEVRNRTNPFPADTLHVGVLAGQPFARTYLGLSTFEVTDDLASITGGTLRLFDNGEDSFNAEAADMVACPASELVVPDDAGDWDAQPGFDCGVSSDVVLVEGSDPLEWEIDLDPFAEVFAGELAPGLAIVERGALDGDDATPDPQETWQVSFDATTREEAALAPDSTALIGELERIAAAFDPETIQAVLSDPESLPTFLVLQVAPDVNAVYAQSRVARQTDPERDLRPATADLELAVETFDVDGFGDGEDMGELPGFDDGEAAGAGDSEPFTPQEPAPSADGGSAAFDAPVAAGSDGSGGAPLDTAADEVAVADGPATADADDDTAETAAEAPAAAGAERLDGTPAAETGSNPPVLLLLPLALGLAGALGWSLTAPTAMAEDRRGGALDRLMQGSRS